ncbi:hypothetical protein VTK26DRAFT_5685 [Humicola hyalothermophila]
MEQDGGHNNTIDNPKAAPAEKSGAHVAVTQVEDDLPLPSHDDTPERVGVSEKRNLESPDQNATRANPKLPDTGPGFVAVSGDVHGHGHNETFVDIVAVPCPGADPLQTYTYNYSRSSGDCSPADFGSRSSLHISSPWVMRDLRKRISIARVFLYKHRVLQEGMTLESLSEDLLEQVEQARRGIQSRPLFFVAHSIGGLVVKNALVMASQSSKYLEIMENCHGVTFFGTPHRGSSYMSMSNFKQSIRELLHLQSTLPRSLTDEIRVNNRRLVHLHDVFVDMASELRVWSFYETQESLLSGSGTGFESEVQVSAPLVSVKSALLDLWEEDVFAVESDHAHLACFEPSNKRILMSYLAEFGAAIKKAARLSQAHKHTPLHLEDHVEVEIVGFYEDPEALMASPRPSTAQQSGAEAVSTIRLYSTKYSLRDFLRKGPDRCLAERLHKGPKRRPSQNRGRGRPESVRPAKEAESHAAKPGLPPNAVDASEVTTDAHSPEIIVTAPGERTVSLKTPAHSEPTMRPPSPDSIASVSTTTSDPGVPFPIGLGGDDTQPLGLLVKQQAEFFLKEHEFTGAASFSRFKPSLRKFMWIHLPFNNPVWVKDIFATLAKHQGRDFSRLFDYDNWGSKHVQNRNSETQPAFLKSTCKYLSAADRLASPRIPSPLFSPGLTPNTLYLYLPYLHFDTYLNMIKRRRLIQERRAHGRAKPVPKQVAEMESLEFKVIWEYIGFDPPLNCRRTLDQFGHHSLHDTDSRDDDQMLYKLTKEDVSRQRNKSRNDGFARSAARRSSFTPKGTIPDDTDPEDDQSETEQEMTLKDGSVLMVDQLWLWSVDMRTLATFFSRRESSPTEGTLFQQADLRNSVYNELNGDLTGRTENTLDLAALIVWHAVTVLLDRSSHSDLEIFRLFDEAIGMLAERMTMNMKQFRVHALDLESDADAEDSDESDPEGESPAAIKKRHKRELERSERENRENTSALLELRDLEDELTTLRRLFEIQENTIKSMKDIYTSNELNEVTKNGQDYLDEALDYLDEYQQTTTELLKRVETTRNDYEKMLEMVQRQAQVDEVRWSRLQAELASSQNLSVMIFTTFTVIFLPLTFFTGLFGMNTIEWQEENIPSLREIGAISLPASVLLIVMSLIAAFSWRAQKFFKKVYRGGRATLKAARRLYSEKLEPESRKEAKKMRREEKKRQLRQAQMLGLNDQGYDFWAKVKKQQSVMRLQTTDQNMDSPGSMDDWVKAPRS